MALDVEHIVDGGVSRGGRPKIETDLRALIRRMSIENPLWGAPRVHRELLKLELLYASSSGWTAET